VVLAATLPLDDVPEDVVVVVVDAANDANPYATSAPTAKIAMTAMSSSDFLLGKVRVVGTGVVPISIFLLHLRREVTQRA
jgi:hypothetical protein